MGEYAKKLFAKNGYQEVSREIQVFEAIIYEIPLG